MTSGTTKQLAWIEHQQFWSGLLVIMAFLGGLGLGARLTVQSIQWQLQDTIPNSTSTLGTTAQTSDGETVGTIDSVTPENLILTVSDGTQVTLVVTSETEVFEYAGAPTPVLPGENRTQTGLTLADLHPSDMVVVHWVSVEGAQTALSIQKIR